MKEIALHILDVAENSIAAGAGCIRVFILEARSDNLLQIVIEDDGTGIPGEMLATVTDPFVTGRTTRRIGLGLSLLADAAERCSGGLDIASEPGCGTRVTARFRYDHIDRAPLGDTAATMAALIAGNPGVDFVYTHTIDGDRFGLDTRNLLKECAGPRTGFNLAQFAARSIRRQLDRLNRTAESGDRHEPADRGRS